MPVITGSNIEMPTHCPLCHKALGETVGFIILEDESVACVHCWHLAQELVVHGMREQPDWWLTVKKWATMMWHSWEYLNRRARRERQLLAETIEEINSGEVPVVVVEYSDVVDTGGVHGVGSSPDRVFDQR